MDIMIVDDHQIMRQGLRSLIENEGALTITGEADNGRTALREVHRQDPDVVVMDLAMPDLNGTEATRQILQEKPDVKVLALSMHADKSFVRHVLEAGASGYVLKDSAFDELLNAIRTVGRGERYLSPKIADIVIDDYLQQPSQEESKAYTELSSREREILQQIAEGKTTKEIASNLYVSVKTIETHRRNIMQTLGIDSVANLTKYAVREGLTSLGE